MATTFSELISLEKIDDQKESYRSRFNPEKMGNTANIAYGGCTLAIAVAAAHASIPSSHKLYSAQGSFLGPAVTDRPFFCSVRETRSTRTFSTRIVEVTQRQDNGKERLCLIMLCDFMVPEAPMMEYSKPPPDVTRFDECLEVDDWREELVAKGTVPRKLANMYMSQFAMMHKFFQTRFTPQGISGQNLLGIVKEAITTQEDRPLTEKTSSDWHRCRTRLSTLAENTASLAFILDAAMAFVGLTHSHMFTDDAGACSTLDFSLRVLVADVDLNQWHVREVKTLSGAEGRTYSEGQFWDAKGKMTASMTQTSILRGHKGSHL